MRMAAEPDAFLPLTRPSADGVDLRALPSSSVVEIASGVKDGDRILIKPSSSADNEYKM